MQEQENMEETSEAAGGEPAPTAAPTVPPPPTIPSVTDQEASGMMFNEVMRETHNRRMSYILRRVHKRIKRMERKMRRPQKIRKLAEKLKRMMRSQTQADPSAMETEPPRDDDAGTTNNSQPHDCTSTSPTPSTSTGPIASTSTGRGMYLSPRTGSGVRTKKSRRDFRLAELESRIRRLGYD